MLLLWTVSVENLTIYNDIVCGFALCGFNIRDQSWISLGCSYELNIVYLQQEKSQYLL